MSCWCHANNPVQGALFRGQDVFVLSVTDQPEINTTSANCFRRLRGPHGVRRMPFPVKAIQVDGGSEFKAEFEDACQRKGIPLFCLPPSHPKLNGRLERANRTFREKFYDCSAAAPTFADLRDDFLAGEHTYNHVRPHQALGYLTPAKFLATFDAAHHTRICHGCLEPVHSLVLCQSPVLDYKPMMSSAFSDVRVIDISSSASGAWCTRLMAGFGASVVLIEPPDGHRLERDDEPATKALAEYVLAGKQRLTLDIRAASERSRLFALIATADVVVSSMTASQLEAMALSYERLDRPDLVMVHVTPYGLNSPLADFPANDLAISARSGWAAINGRGGKPPLKPSGWQASYYAGVAAFTGAVAALIHRDNHPGEGQEIDTGELDAMVAALAPALLRAQYMGAVPERSISADITTGPVPVADGYFALTISRAHFWRDAMNVLGLPDLAMDPRWEASWYRNANKAEYLDRVQTKMAEWSKADLFDELAARRVVAGPVLEFHELVNNEHLRARGFWGPGDAAAGDASHAGAPFKMSETPWSPERSDGEPRPASTPHRRPKPEKPTDVRRRGPLVGIRGIVLTQAWAGALCTELLGMLGADVIQIEVRKRPDSWRGSYDAPVVGPLSEMATALHSWNTSPLFNSVNLGKRSVTLDLHSAEGLAVYRRLVAHADFVAENFSPRVLGNLGLGYEALRAIRPDIILCSLSAYGHDGPWANVPGIGGTIEPTSGMSALLGYEGGPPMNSGQMYPDAVAGLYGCSAILTALLHRNRTGEGQYIDLSMQEANLTFIGDAAIEFLRTGRQRPRLGNRHPAHAPHGIYETRDGQWVAIACESTEQWIALASTIGADSMLSDERLRLATNRRASASEIDDAISAWTCQQDRDQIAATLSAAGVIAAPVLDSLEVAADASLRSRGTVEDVQHPEAGTWPQAGLPIHFSRTPGKVVSSAPLQGEHSFEVLSELLGMSREEYDRLVEAGVSGMGPPA